MSENKVFHHMKMYYRATGRVMQGPIFIREVAMRFSKDEVVEGILLFNEYLDEQRKGVS
ncbi:hypothetical protein [Bacillus aerolatus]|uniref:hypothetical protein n=1 Tax=Bacillus aerolatus TaxID=2653354 RepID=UPI00177EB2BB|nr:hypothetical protein [Bacillus aerolatus]